MKIFPSRRKNSRVLGALASPTIRFLMRVSFIISCILAVSVQLSAFVTSGQSIDNIEITVEFEDARLVDILKLVQNKTQINFAYSPDDVTAIGNITVDRRKRSVRMLLDLVLKETNLGYQEDEGTVVIYKRKLTANGMLDDQIGNSTFPAKGTVRSSDRSPMAGVNVFVKGTSRGIATDAQGKFELDVNIGETLVFTFIGYKTLETLITEPTLFEVIMEEDATTLKEIEVIGTDYFSTSKQKSTMNIFKVEGKEIADQPVTSVINSIIGRVPGLDITPVSNFPGRAPSIQIRGNNSLTNRGATPLYVIDGVQIDSRPLNDPFGSSVGGYDPLAGISPANIESIEVLKDAAATAIYGSRGANGVVRITTKQAKGNKRTTNFDFNVYTGVGKIANKVDVLNSEQYLAMRREAFKNAGTTPGMFDHDLNGNWDTTRVTDWQDVLLGGTARISDFQGSFTGGNESTSFRVGGGYHHETTVFPGDDFSYQRGNADASFRHLSANGKLEVTAGINIGFTDNQSYNYSQFATLALTLPPVAPTLYKADGTLNWQGVEIPFRMDTWQNPLSELLTRNNITTYNTVANSTIGYELLPGLKAKVQASLSHIANDETRINPVSAFAPAIRPYVTSSMNFVTNDRRSFMIEPQIKYGRTLGNHSLSVDAGLTYQQSRSIYKSVHGSGYPSDALLSSIRGATAVNNLADENTQYKYASAFIHMGYSFNNRYLLDVTGRRDGSSKFGPGKRYGNFGAVGVGWLFSETALIQENFSFISFGKIRGSYGITGNDQIGDYLYLDTYAILNPGYQGGVSLKPSALYNPDYHWEETKKMEFALEVALLANRVSLETAWYRNLSTNQLISYHLSDVTGFQSVLKNFDATIENTGWEFAITTQNISKENLRWTTSFNLSVPKNTLLEFEGIETSPYSKQYKVGEALTIQRRFTYSGINPETGLFSVEDVNGDGIYNDSDMRFSKVAGRSSYYGLNNTLSYASLELSFLLQFSNNRIIDYMLISQPGAMSNQPIEVMDRWQQQGDLAAYQKFMPGYEYNYGNVTTSDHNIRDASFVRLRTVSFSYRFNQKLLSKIKLQDVRIYLQGQNLVTFSKFNGFDPETGNAMPPLRILSMGLQFKL